MAIIKYRIWAFFLIGLLGSVSVYGREPRVSVGLGQGQLSLRVEGLDLSPAQQQSLRNELLVRDDLAPILTSQDTRQISVEGAALKKIQRLLEHEPLRALQQLEAIVAFQIRQMAFQDSDQLQARAPPSSSKVIMGQDFLLDKNEAIDELVVVGGTAEIRGRVSRLVIMSGTVVLKGGSVVDYELVNLGGTLEIEEGAQITGDQREMGFPGKGSSWSMFFHDIDQLEKIIETVYPNLAWVLALIGLLMFLFFHWVGKVFSPRLQTEISAFLQQRKLASLGAGIAGILFIFPLTILLAITFVGVALIPIQYALVFLFFIFGLNHIFMFIAGSSEVLARAPDFVKIGLGFAVFTCLSWVPYVGIWLQLALALAGFGAAHLAMLRRLKDRPRSKSAVHHPSRNGQA